MRSGPGAQITLTYNQWSGETATDPVTGEKAGTATRVTETVYGLVHEVGPATTVARMYAEIQVGDAILDLPTDTALDGKEDLVFTFGGNDWVQKKVGKELAKSWDACWGDQRIHRTILVTRKN
jgi:hypothetical protein